MAKWQEESEKQKKTLWLGIGLGGIILLILLTILLAMWQRPKEKTEIDDRIPYSEERDPNARLKKLEDGVIQNENPGVVAEHEIDGLRFHDLQLTQGEDGIGLFAQVTNVSKEDFSSLIARKMVFLDNQGRKVGVIKIHIDPIPVGETTPIYSQLAYEGIPEEETEFVRFNVSYVYDYQINSCSQP